MLFEDVDQLEIQGEGTGRGDAVGEIHRLDHRHDFLTLAAGSLAVPSCRLRRMQGAYKLLETQQPFELLGTAFAAQDGEPEVLDQFEAFTQHPNHPRRPWLGSDGKGRWARSG